MPDGSKPAPHPQHRDHGAPFEDEAVPSYLEDTYTWAYLSRFGTRFFDHQAVVNAILWGNADRLIDWVLADLPRTCTVWQPAAVYGGFSRRIARHIGPGGHLTVTDVAPVQVALTARKVADLPMVTVTRHDARRPLPTDAPLDAVTCFFLLHEVPPEAKRAVVSATLETIRVGGQVIFVDYHRPEVWHPLRPIMAGVFATLEPFARELWDTEIFTLAPAESASTPTFDWRKETLFGGLYQKVIATRRS